jgi:hypothetical protein
MKLARVATAALAGAAAAVLAFAGPAAANGTININSGNVPTTAAKADQNCTDQGPGQFSDADTWVFVLPDKNLGTFVSITANFTEPPANTPHVVVITAAVDTGSFLQGGNATPKAWITTPAGWTLTGASAEVTGTVDPEANPTPKFNLTHACAAGGVTPSPTPSKTDSNGDGGDDGGTPPTTTSTTIAPPPGGGDSLPVTGVALTGIITAGVVLVGGGATLLVLHRRRSMETNA